MSVSVPGARQRLLGHGTFECSRAPPFHVDSLPTQYLLCDCLLPWLRFSRSFISFTDRSHAVENLKAVTSFHSLGSSSVFVPACLRDPPHYLSALRLPLLDLSPLAARKLFLFFPPSKAIVTEVKMPSLKFFLNPAVDDAGDEKKRTKRRPFSLSAAFARSPVEPVAPAVDIDAPAEATSAMIALARKIVKETEKLDAYLKANGLPTPSFDVDAPSDFPKLPVDMLKSRQEIIFATKELSLLAHGPRESLRWGVWEFLDVLALQIVNHFGIGESELFELISRSPLP